MGGAESLRSLMQRVRRHGLEDEMRAMLAEYAVRVVLTSHPTQFYPGNVLAIITDLALAMEDNDLVKIRKRLHQLGLTPFFQSEPPTPYEEAIRQIWYLENVFFEACSALGARVANALGRPDGEGLNNGMLRIGFWPGGDRDGNPYVGADTTLRVARKLKLTLLRCYRKEFRELRRLMTFKGLEGELDMLQGMIEEAIFNPSDLSLKQDVLLAWLGPVGEEGGGRVQWAVPRPNPPAHVQGADVWVALCLPRHPTRCPCGDQGIQVVARSAGRGSGGGAV